MKTYILTLLIAISIVSCSKSGNYSTETNEKEWYRVSAIGADTSRTNWMLARTTGALVIDEDSKLKAELIGYSPAPNGMGIYTIRVTNKQNCRILVRWGWEGLTIDDVQPTSDVVQANGTQEFILKGDAKIGKIKVKAEGTCGNSSTLIIPITMNVLPITFLENKTTRDAKTGKVTVSFSIDDPSTVEWFLIERMKGTESSQAALIASDKVTRSFTIKL